MLRQQQLGQRTLQPNRLTALAEPSMSHAAAAAAACRDNLEPDLYFWQTQVQRTPSVQDILDMSKTHPEISKLPSTSRLVELRGNRLRFPHMPPGPRQFFCDAE